MGDKSKAGNVSAWQARLTPTQRARKYLEQL